MLNRIHSHPYALASAGITGAAMLLTAALVLGVYAYAGDVPIRRRLLGGLLAWSWMAIPYFLALAAAIYVAPWRRRSATMLLVIIAATALATWVIARCLLFPTSTVAIALMVLPLFQSLGVLVGIWGALALHPPDKAA